MINYKNMPKVPGKGIVNVNVTRTEGLLKHTNSQFGRDSYFFNAFKEAFGDKKFCVCVSAASTAKDSGLEEQLKDKQLRDDLHDIAYDLSGSIPCKAFDTYSEAMNYADELCKKLSYVGWFALLLEDGKQVPLSSESIPTIFAPQMI